jgi:VanZ family protein
MTHPKAAFRLGYLFFICQYNSIKTLFNYSETINTAYKKIKNRKKYGILGCLVFISTARNTKNKSIFFKVTRGSLNALLRNSTGKFF